MSDTRMFAEVLFGDLRDEEYIEVRFIPPKDQDRPIKQSWHKDIDSAIEAALKPPPGYDSYVGVCPRIQGGGSTKDVTRVQAIWADIDSYKEAGRTAEDVTEQLKKLASPPTMIVGSGGGLHVYWLLEEECQKKPAKRMMQRIAQTLNGDRATSDPARVLRWPGTANRKEETPRMVKLITVNYGNRYTFTDLEKTFGEVPAPDSAQLQLDEPVALGKRTLDFLETGVLPDDDNPERNHLLGIARNLHSNGWDEDEAATKLWAALQEHMEDPCYRCDPNHPWAYRDVVKIVDSIFEAEPTVDLVVPEPIEFEPGGTITTARLVPLTDEDWENRDPELHYLVDQYLLRREMTMLTGGFGTGKSWLALDLALAVADPERETWLGFDVHEHGRVLYFDEENDRDGLLERMTLLGYKGGLLGKQLYVFSFSGLALDRKDWVRELHTMVDNVEPKLCVFDTFVRFSSQDENDNSAVARIYRDALTPVSRMYDSAVVTLDHPRKGTQDISRGAGDKVNVLDRAWSLIGEPGEATATLKHVKPPRRGKLPSPLEVTREENIAGVRLVSAESDGENVAPGRPKDVEKRRIVAEALSEPRTFQELHDLTGVPKSTLGDILQEFEDNDDVDHKDGQWRWTSSF